MPAVDVIRVLTGVSGLDDILSGGLPERRMYLVKGTPGVGKTTLALQFLLYSFLHSKTSTLLEWHNILLLDCFGLFF